jgi:DNA-directed RNA polymerase subunit RPC12/RpoP
MNLSCPECGGVFELEPSTKAGNQLTCPHCNFRAQYNGPTATQEVSLEDKEDLTPYEQTMLDFLQEQEEREAEQRRLDNGGYDYKGNSAWRSFMRDLGRLQS